jgi:hypothetical protein
MADSRKRRSFGFWVYFFWVYLGFRVLKKGG